jgi:hypothetical protein
MTNILNEDVHTSGDKMTFRVSNFMVSQLLRCTTWVMSYFLCKPEMDNPSVGEVSGLKLVSLKVPL